ncbi:MAG: CPBP family intramembrane metalloprotease [Planctomycetes bacterium]|nr:CPBP family intramembrane metalloprotease [Planctomycetota bacterium]
MYSTGLFRSACDSQTPTSLLGCPFSCGCRSERYSPASTRTRTPRLFAANKYRFVYGQEPHTKSKKNFPLELRAKTLRLTNTGKDGQRRLWKWLSIVLSAACFAVAHIIVWGQIISVLTFLPGLICGWLFIRTRSLLAPILFHGLANTCYLLMAATFI